MTDPLMDPADGALRPNATETGFEQYRHGQWVPFLEPRSIFTMTPEQRHEIMANNPPEITGIHHANVYLDWSWMGCGYGQLSFSVDRETGKLTCMDEHMGKERVRTLLIALANYVADNATFD